MSPLLVLALVACSRGTSDCSTETDPLHTGATAEETGTPEVTGDALVHLARSDTSSFWETTDVLVVGEAVYTCTGTKSLVVHDATEPERIRQVKTLEFDGSGPYPRCSHLDAHGERLVVTSRRDEVQPTAFVALVDVSSPLEPEILDEWSQGTAALLEEAAVVGDRVYVASHQGVRILDIGDDQITPLETWSTGPVTRVTSLGDGVAAGDSSGRVLALDAEGGARWTAAVGGGVQALLDLDDGRLLVAAGSVGLVTLDADSGEELARTPTHGTALRLDRMETGEVLVANWSDVRLYDVTGNQPRVVAVDAVFQASERPRHLAADGGGGHVYAGEWEGIHSLCYHPERVGPELTPSDLSLAVPEDGQPHEVELTVTNEGQLDLHVTGLDVPSGWTASAESLELEPGEASTLTLSWEGGSKVERHFLVLDSDDPDEPEARVELRVGSDRVFLGDPAPSFSYTALNTGEPMVLSDQRGKVVLLSYFATF